MDIRARPRIPRYADGFRIMAVNNNFPQAPAKVTLDVPTLRLIIQAINSIVKGKLNCCGETALTASAASTTINDPLCNPNSVILFTPTTAHAAVEIATLYYTAGTGSFVIHHANNSQTDRIFRYVIIG